jgi:AcrR family transcriptional regulator
MLILYVWVRGARAMTTPVSGRTKQELSKAILHTANCLFAEHGVESVSMHQIAKSVGIGQGTLYRRYANKGDLCMEMMKDNFDQFKAQIEQFLLDNASRPVKDKLVYVMREIISFIDKKFKWLEVIHIHASTEHEKTDFFRSPPYLFLKRVMTGLFHEAVEQKLVKPLDINYIVHSYFALHSPIIIRQLRQELGYSCEDIQERFCAMFIDPLFY